MNLEKFNQTLCFFDYYWCISTLHISTRYSVITQRAAMSNMMAQSVANSTTKSWILTSATIFQTSRYVHDAVLPPLHHLPCFTCLWNGPTSLHDLEMLISDWLMLATAQRPTSGMPVMTVKTTVQRALKLVDVCVLCVSSIACECDHHYHKPIATTPINYHHHTYTWTPFTISPQSPANQPGPLSASYQQHTHISTIQ